MHSISVVICIFCKNGVLLEDSAVACCAVCVFGCEKRGDFWESCKLRHSLFLTDFFCISVMHFWG